MASSAIVSDPERQPLLPRRETPLPKLQLFIICLVRLAEPLAFTQIFPYINRMVELFHLTENPADIGWYSGMIDSVFAFAQLLMMYQWAKLSDRIGRRPCVLFSVMGSATATLVFGFSRNIYTAVFARVVAGLMAGNVAVIESMVGEVTDKTNQARAFMMVGLVWYSGSIMGTLLGGCLSEPAERLPSLFGGIQFLSDFPFFLPCLVAYVFAMTAVIIGFFWLEETLPSKRKHSRAEKSAGVPPQAAAESRRWTAWALLSDPTIRSVVAPYLILSIQCIGFEVLFTLFSYSALSIGGLNRTPFEIGIAMAFAGVVAVVMHPIAFPWLSKRIALKKLYFCLMLIFPICYLATPFLNVVARNMSVSVSDSSTDGDQLTPIGRVVVWVLVCVVLLVVRMGGMAFAAHTIFVKHAAPSPEALGGTFGLLHTIGATGRAIGPSLVSSLFAITASHNLLGGWFVWVFMTCVGGVALFLTTRVRDGAEEREECLAAC